MDAKIKIKLEARAKIIKSIAHPTRIFIVETLSKHPRCVCELTDMIGADISTVSKHLSILKNAGIVDIEKRGTQVWYSLKCPCILDFINCVESVIRDNARWMAELARK
jgi:DNA-binding transcriptional ArsR family regulator